MRCCFRACLFVSLSFRDVVCFSASADPTPLLIPCRSDGIRGCCSGGGSGGGGGGGGGAESITSWTEEAAQLFGIGIPSSRDTSEFVRADAIDMQTAMLAGSGDSPDSSRLRTGVNIGGSNRRGLCVLPLCSVSSVPILEVSNNSHCLATPCVYHATKGVFWGSILAPTFFKHVCICPCCK